MVSRWLKQVKYSINISLELYLTTTEHCVKLKHVSLEDCIDYLLILPDESWPLQDILNKELANISSISDVVATTSNSMEFLRTMLGKESRIGFQAIIGLEEPIRSGALVHIPLTSKNHNFTQIFTICVHRNQEITPINESILKLLSQRLDR